MMFKMSDCLYSALLGEAEDGNLDCCESHCSFGGYPLFGSWTVDQLLTH